MPWRRAWRPTPVSLPGKFHEQRNLACCSPWGHKRVGHTLATEQQHVNPKLPIHPSPPPPRERMFKRRTQDIAIYVLEKWYSSIRPLGLEYIVRKRDKVDVWSCCFWAHETAFNSLVESLDPIWWAGECVDIFYKKSTRLFYIFQVRNSFSSHQSLVLRCFL